MEKYPGISPYAYCAGNPMNLVDPDGRFPWGAALGAGVDYFSQVYNNFREGYSGKDAFYNRVNFASVALSAINPVGKLKVVGTAAVELAKATFSYIPERGFEVNKDTGSIITKTSSNTLFSLGLGKLFSRGTEEAVISAKEETNNAVKNVRKAMRNLERHPNSPKAAEALDQAQSAVSLARESEVESQIMNKVKSAEPALQNVIKETIRGGRDDNTSRQ